jgi:hypothetical protein
MKGLMTFPSLTRKSAIAQPRNRAIVQVNSHSHRGPISGYLSQLENDKVTFQRTGRLGENWNNTNNTK